MAYPGLVIFADSSPGTACRNSSWTFGGREVESPLTYSSWVSSPSGSEDLVARGIRELHDLVLDRGTVPRTPPADRSAVERRLLEMILDDLLHRLAGPGDPAGDLPREVHLLEEGEPVPGIL